MIILTSEEILWKIRTVDDTSNEPYDSLVSKYAKMKESNKNGTSFI
ncbi:MAG: hypothetical protein HN439_02230 [Euryarchaeota archaeon]|jgi:hypothetical protein|nr:hypothetical protein [Euryarchaeota archaeon]